MTFELISTEDGSLSLKDNDSGELFHNRAGAYSEALLNYVQPSRAVAKLNSVESELAVLDVCFGLGYNSYVLLEEALRCGSVGNLRIVAIEPDHNLLGLAPQIVRSGKFPFLSKTLDELNEMALGNFQRERVLSGFCNGLEFNISLLENTLQSLLPEIHDDFDLIFHDPFSAKRAPELWTADIFGMYRIFLQNKKGAVLTYSAASAVRGGLREVGFEVRKTTALGGKSGGTIAMFDAESAHFSFTELDEGEKEKLDSASGVPYRSRGFGVDRSVILQARTVEQAQYKRLGKD